MNQQIDNELGGYVETDAVREAFEAGLREAKAKYLPVLEKLVEGLEFYADFENNTDDGQYQTHEYGDPDNMFTLDEGEIAKSALALAAPLLGGK